MLKNRYYLFKILFNIILLIAGAVGVALLLGHIQNTASEERQRAESEQSLSGAIMVLENNAKDATELTSLFHSSNESTLLDLSGLLDAGMLDELGAMSREEAAVAWEDLMESAGVDYMFIMTHAGKLMMAPETGLFYQNLVSMDLLSEENLSGLTACSSDAPGHVQEKNDAGHYYFYSVPVRYKGMDCYLVLGTEYGVLEMQLATLNDVSHVLESMSAGSGFLFAVDTENHKNTFLCFEGDESLAGKNALSCGMTEEALQDGYAGQQVINGVTYYCVSKTYGASTVICAVKDSADVYGNNQYVLFWSVTAFVLVAVLCLAYAAIVRDDLVLRKKESKKVHLFRIGKSQLLFNKTVADKVAPLLLVGVIAVFLITFYAQTLLGLAEALHDSSDALDQLEAGISDADGTRSTVETYYDSQYESKAELLAYFLEESSDPLNIGEKRYHTAYDENGQKYYLTDDEGNRLASIPYSEDLDEYCRQNSLLSVYLFDENGRTIATNTKNWFFILSNTPGDQSYEFRDVLDGKMDFYIQEAEEDELGDTSQYIGVPYHYYTTTDADGDTLYVTRAEYETQQADESRSWSGSPITKHTGLLQIGLDISVVNRMLATTDYTYILSSFDMSEVYLVLFDDTEDHTVLYSPIETSIGKTASEIGVSASAFTGSYNGFQTANGSDYFMSYRYRNGYYIATAIPTDTIYEGRLSNSLYTALIAFLFVVLLGATAMLSTEEEEKLFDELAEEELGAAGGSVFNMLLPSGKVGTTVRAASRWDNKRIPWNAKSPEQKLMVLLEGVAVLLIVYIMLLLLGAKTIFGSDSIVMFIINGGWDRGLNVFAFSACGAVMVFTIVVVSLIRVPVRLVTAVLGTKSETVGHLLLSVIKYGGAFAALFYSLYMLGMDTTSLLTSAGIFSLVIGLGAQSLIKDILAGIFIVFEGEFRVGDIVTIGDYRGQVLDIGLRTTKVMNAANNIKIFNNSEISGVLNMTKETSVAKCVIGIEYGQDIEFVESVLARELPKLKDKLPKIINGPTYLGISELAASSVNLLIIAGCQEKDVPSLGRQLNREILNIFYQNDINVPFNQITVSYREEAGKQMAFPSDGADDPENRAE